MRLMAKHFMKGLGIRSIFSALNEEGDTTKKGLKWYPAVIRSYLSNKKLAGNLLLQKYFVEDPITKKKKKNKSEIPQYFVKGNHKAVFESEVFEKPQDERINRAIHFYAPLEELKSTALTSKIVCCKCDAHFQRKKANGGSKYEHYIWICQTFNRKGKNIALLSRYRRRFLFRLLQMFWVYRNIIQRRI